MRYSFSSCSSQPGSHDFGLLRMSTISAIVGLSSGKMETPLHLAADVGDVTTMSVLLKAGADPNSKDESGNIPVHRAVQHCQVSAIETLKACGANINAQKGNGETPLHIATAMKDNALVNVLLQNGADPNVGDENGTIPLHIACKLDDVPISKALVAAGSNVKAKGEGKNTPLHYASRNMNKVLVEMLITKGANAKEPNADGRTPLQGVKLTFCKFMKGLIGEERKLTSEEEHHVEPGDIMSQNGSTFNSVEEVKDAFCLLCRRHTATSAMLPCGHLCVCEACQRERISNTKICPICKNDICGAVCILADI